MEKPNILWICSDQQRWDTLGCYGNTFTKTPNLDRLAETGVLFKTAFCQNPVCTPSRSSFMTGRYPRTTRCRANGQAIPEDEVLVSRLFRDAGYFCGLSGKLHLSPCHPNACPGIERRIDDGYHVFDWSHHPEYDRKNDHLSNAYNLWLRKQGKEFALKNHPRSKHVGIGIEEQYHQTTWCVDRAISFLDNAKAKGSPWFYSLNFFDPHHPFDPPEKYLAPYLEHLDDIPMPVDREGPPKTIWEKTDRIKGYGGWGMPGNLGDDEHRLVRAAYWAMCDLIDVQIGRLFEHLHETCAWDNTIIIYTSDHGELLGDHGMYYKGPHFYEQCVHVPLIMCGAGLPVALVEEPVELLDIAPTLCDLAGIPPHPGMQGRSLMPRLRGEAPPHKTDIYCEFMDANFDYDPPAYGTMLRTEHHKIVRFHSPGNECGLLFNLKEDPDETCNLWDDPSHAQLRSELLERLSDRIAMTVDPLPLKQGSW